MIASKLIIPEGSGFSYYALTSSAFDAQGDSVSLRAIELDKIPQIPIQIFKDGDCSVSSLLGFPNKVYSRRKHLLVVAPEVISAEEEEHAPSRLVPYECFLLGC